MLAAKYGPGLTAGNALNQEIVLLVDTSGGVISYASEQAEAFVGAALCAQAPTGIARWPTDDGKAVLTAIVAGNVPSVALPTGVPLPGWALTRTQRCGGHQVLTFGRHVRPADERFRALLDHASIGVVVHRNFKPLYANHVFARLFGFPSIEAVLRSDVLGLSRSPLEMTREQAWRELSECIQTQKQWSYPMQRLDGLPVHVDMRYRSITWGDEPAVVMSMVDASERRRQEDAIERLRQQIYEALDAISDGFALWDSDDRLIVANRSMDRVTPLSKGIFRPGISFADAMREHCAAGEFELEEGETVDAYVAKRTALHQAHRHNREMLNSDGEWYLISERPTSDDGIVGVYTNITQLKAVQADLDAERAKAEAANAAKSNFLAMMSHELRTPMAGIRGIVDLMRMSDQTAEQSRHLEQLERSTDSLLTMLNDILDYSKIEAGHLALETIPFSVVQTLQETCSLFDHTASSRGNALALEIAPAVPEWARGDPGRIRQVLMNLVGNAIKFTEHGRIDIRAQASEPAGKAQERQGFVLSVTVSDTGIGIAKDQLDDLFCAFTQADASTTRRFGGTGLGLAICRNLVEAMGGRITVDSAPDQGATFTFKIPLAACGVHEIPQTGGERPLPRADFTGVRVLLAEDNALNRSLISAILSKLGFVVDVATNGAEAVDTVTRLPDLDLVLMDMQMPVMDGPEAVRRIRSMNGPVAKLPIIALTADAMPEHRERYLAAGLDAILTKPIAWEHLAATVRALFVERASTAEARSVVAEPRSDTLPLFDSDTLKALLEAVGDSALLAMVDKMLAAAERRFDQIGNAQTERDHEAIETAAHDLKGMAANFGAARLADVAEELQVAAAERCETGALVSVMGDVLSATCAEVPDLRRRLDPECHDSGASAPALEHEVATV